MRAFLALVLLVGVGGLPAPATAQSTVSPTPSLSTDTATPTEMATPTETGTPTETATPGQEKVFIEVPVDFVKVPQAKNGREEDLTADDIDKALGEVNEIFKKCCIKFTRSGFSTLADPAVPSMPAEDGTGEGGKFTKEQKDVADAGRKQAKADGDASKLVAVIISKFKNPNRDTSSLQGRTAPPSTVLITDPFNIERNTLGMTNFPVILAHELGHTLGLSHNVLKSDANYPHQANGRYTSPNLMSPDPDRDSKELTQD